MAELVVGLENGQKKLIPTSSEARSGNPLGSFLLVYGNTVPIGYLPLETLFDENQYPALYAMLGTNKTPDTPCDLGADWDNAVAVTLSTTDYTVTENGWLIGYNQAPSNVETKILLNGLVVSDAYNYNGAWFYAGQVQIRVNKGDKIKLSNNASTQDCHFVPFKKYAHVVIKATSGLEETQQEYVLQSLKAIIDGEVIWENPNPTQNYGSTSNVSLITGKKFSDYRIISIECTNSAIIYVNVSDFVNYPTYCTSSGNENGWENGSAVIFSRGFRYKSDTAFDVGNCYVGGYTYNNNKIPLRIKGYK